MKIETILIVVAIAFTSTGHAQTNTFPSSGNVGIGTTSPSALLEVYGGGNILLRGANDNAGDLVFQSSSHTELGRIWTNSSGSTGMYFSSGDLIADLTIDQSGNVGIGTTNTPEQLAIGLLTSSPNIKLSRWAFLGQESSHLTTVLGGNAKALGSRTAVVESTVDGYRAIRMKYDEGITFHAFRGSVASGDTVAHERMRITPTGDVGIGTATPAHKLAVNGTIRAKEVIVDTGWSDFVFEDSYQLRSLDEVESHIETHGHLPDVPSAATVEAEGLSVGEAQKIMMQKIEELTLYMIEKDKQVAALQARVAELESK